MSELEEILGKPAESLDGPTLLDDLATQIRRYVVMDEDQVDTVALWIMHAWCIEAFWTTGRLHILSPEQECGKTRLLQTIQGLLGDSIRSASISAAVLYRRLANGTPTFLVDEVDQSIGSGAARDSEFLSAIIGILNDGYTKGATVPRINRKTMNVEEFPTFCPVAIAGISSQLSDAFLSRTIPINLRRRLRHEEVDRWIDGPELRAGFDQLRARIETWAEMHVESLGARRIEYPEDLSDRQAECWGPLITIAAEVGGDWPERVARAYRQIVLDPIELNSAGHQLLVDVRDVFEGREWMSTKTLLERLNALESAAYGSWNKGEGLNEKTLSLKLAPYRVKPIRRMIEGERHKGYEREAFSDAWARYAPISPDANSGLSLFSYSGGDNGNAPKTQQAGGTVAPAIGTVVARSDDGSTLTKSSPDDGNDPHESWQSEPSPRQPIETLPPLVFDDQDRQDWDRGEF